MSDDDPKPEVAAAVVPTPHELRTAEGVLASVVAHPDGEVLRVHDRRGRLLVQVGADGSVILHVEEGDLELRAHRGRVRIHGSEGVEIGGPQVTIETPHLRQVVGVLETHAKRILERAKDSYRDVEGVSSITGRQIRLVAKDTLRAVAERLRLRAHREAKVQADKIYLG